MQRSNFTSKIGFVMAAAGSAVGLGNIWRFPYLAAQYGGGIFLLVYILLAITFGFALMATEIAIGRKTGLSAVEAFKALDRKWAFVGYLGALVPVIILPYYSVIGGWVFKYLSVYISGEGHLAAEGSYFGQFIGQVSSPLLWFTAFIGITSLVVLFGVEKGVEKCSKIMMPILIVLSIFIAVYSLFMENALTGLRYYIIPDFSKFSIKTVLSAMGQLFYSMSLAMGIMITYGSYMKKEDSIESSVRQIEIFDTGIAFLAGLMIIPSIFALGGEEALLSKGPSLMFIVLPQVFDKMPLGSFIGFTFFLMVLFAALTSSISLMETVVSIVQDKLKWSRTFTCIIIFIFSLIIGTPSSLGNGIWGGIKIMGMQLLDFFDFISNSVLMPIVALFTCIVAGYVVKPKAFIDEIELNGSKFKAKKLYIVVVKYIAPICIVLILLTSLLSAFGYLSM